MMGQHFETETKCPVFKPVSEFTSNPLNKFQVMILNKTVFNQVFVN